MTGIALSHDLDLGLDPERVRPADAARQRATVEELLRRLYGRNGSPVQVLADEVGMGKTFVALGAAYSVLAAADAWSGDLKGCYQKVLIVTPRNRALFRKWQRAVTELVDWCMPPSLRATAHGWFAARPVERLDELVAALRRRGSGPRVIVTHTGLFYGGKLRDSQLKSRFILGVLFKYWGNRFDHEARRVLLRSLDGWPQDPDELLQLEEWETERIPFTRKELRAAIERSDVPGEGGEVSVVEHALECCREIATPYFRDRETSFNRWVLDPLRQIYKDACAQLIQRALPLVIVDEAHNWKNKAHGFPKFAEFIGPRTRRLLLLTATPFQLHPKEMLTLLRLGEVVAPATGRKASTERVEQLGHHCGDIIGPVLANSASASLRFARAWTRLPRRITTEVLAEIWRTPALVNSRQRLVEVAEAEGVVDAGTVDRLAREGTANLDPDVRELMREALKLRAYNADLSQELGTLVIRHRRGADHRHYLVGSEYGVSGAAPRPDAHLLHPAAGLDVRGVAELPHYLLMRCVAELRKLPAGRGQSMLGSALTGCYSTLLASAEGRAVKSHLKHAPVGQRYLELLLSMVGTDKDPIHPKLRRVVDTVVDAWRRGEKSLVFCFRTNTAERLRDIIHDEIAAELRSREQRCLGGSDRFDALRKRMQGRDRDLVGLGLDRLLWSYWWAHDPADVPFSPADLALTDNDLVSLARVAARCPDVDLRTDNPDRVFLHRAIEHVIGSRLLSTSPRRTQLPGLLAHVASLDWVASPYGQASRDEDDEEGEDEQVFDERGVDVAYRLTEPASEDDVRQLAADLVRRRRHARKQSLVDAYAQGPSFWLGAAPAETPDRASERGRLLSQLHGLLWRLSRKDEQTDAYDWRSRQLVFKALRRVLTRRSVLLRLLPERSELEEARWGELLARAFFGPLAGQAESMADRIAVFLEDLCGASGSVYERRRSRRDTDVQSGRYVLYDATRLRLKTHVALVTGSSAGRASETRERIFAGFNSPLTPEVLVCTSVGQEGIDLHRHCRHVIHYDLAWNPAVIEQRTGRVDRIGSKTARERARAGSRTRLEIGVPFLAGTYDERMFEELRLRAQTFEVLTGGDLASDRAEGHDDADGAEDAERGLFFVPLPAEMVSDLRVSFSVWRGKAE